LQRWKKGKRSFNRTGRLNIRRLATINHVVQEGALPESRRRSTPSRREQIVTAAARLFAERGFHGVTIEELGAAVGISGAALYKHFQSKDDVLSEMLVGISRRLLYAGQREVESSRSPREALNRLLIMQTDFALASPDLIRVQDRDLANLSASEAQKVRKLQRAYVEIWVDVLEAVDPLLDSGEARTKAHAIFGLLNSTPHSAVARSVESVRATLLEMAEASLRVGVLDAP
jgi:AcrR family transcriptional regulator